MTALAVVFSMISPAYSSTSEDEYAEIKEQASGINFTIKGQYKDLFVNFNLPQPSGNSERFTYNLQRLRLSPEVNFYDKLILHVDYDNEIVTGNDLNNRIHESLWRQSQYNDLFHLSWTPYSYENTYYSTGIHNAYAKTTIGDLTVTLGRQQVRFGSGKLWNPLDIFNPLSPMLMLIEGEDVMKGIDALRLEYYVNDSTVLSYILSPKRSNDSLSMNDIGMKNFDMMGRLKTSRWDTDFAGLFGWVSQRYIFGVDVSANFNNGLLRGAVLYNKPEDSRKFTQISAGYEYNFKSGLLFLVEYFYNSDPLNQDQNLKSEYYKATLMTGINNENYYLLSNKILTFNKHYAGMFLGYDITPLFRIEFSSIYDFQGEAVFINPSLKYNIFENINICAGFMKAYVNHDNSETDFDIVRKDVLVYASLSIFF
jgi:hypothetical protein